MISAVASPRTIAQKMQAVGIVTAYGLVMARAMQFVIGLAAALAASSFATACASPTAPGMIAVTSSGTSSGPGSMLVAFPVSACTGTSSAVFLDEKGGFV